MNRESALVVKSMDFSVKIINLYRDLSENNKEYVLSKQILRSGTSIGANIAESQGAQSLPDFISKFHISLKECYETEYWLELLERTKYITNEIYEELLNDLIELKSLLISSIRTTKSKLKSKKSEALR